MAIDAIRLSNAFQGVNMLDNKLERRTIAQDSATNVAESMGQIFEQAVSSLDQSQKAADGNIAALVAGEPVDLHHVMLQMEEAALNLNLALQVRNKVIEAYQEVQRMQV